MFLLLLIREVLPYKKKDSYLPKDLGNSTNFLKLRVTWMDS
jgi:hypothetical protein